MIYSYNSIAVGIYKRPSLSYVDRRTNVFCLINRLSDNPVVNEA